MSLTFEMKTGSGIPASSYAAEFIRAEEFKENLDRYGLGVLLVWKVLEGDFASEEATRIVSAKLSPKTNLNKFVIALNGGPVEPGTKVDLADFYGTRGLIIVEELEGGATRVATFLKQG